LPKTEACPIVQPLPYLVSIPGEWSLHGSNLAQQQRLVGLREVISALAIDSGRITGYPKVTALAWYVG
jgi:hypothetical protein